MGIKRIKFILATMLFFSVPLSGWAQGDGTDQLQQQLQRLKQAVQASSQNAPQSSISANQINPSANQPPPTDFQGAQDTARQGYLQKSSGPIGAINSSAPALQPTNSNQVPTEFKSPQASNQNQVIVPAAPNPPTVVAAGPEQNQVPTELKTGQNAPLPVNPTPVGPSEDLHQKAFLNMTNNVLPMTASQIRALHALFDQTQQAANEYPGVPPLPTSSSIAVNLSPGATPPVIRLGYGFVSSLVFVDATGEPWPVEAYDIGDPKAFNIQWDKKGNILLVQALNGYRAGNLAVVLKGLNTPVMVTLLPGQKAVDYRVDLRIPGIGPFAKVGAEIGLPSSASPVLLDVLNGLKPRGSKRLHLLNCDDCDLWLLRGKLYLRTQLTLLSPGWISSMSSADGTHAYKLNKTPVMLASFHGKMITLIVDGY